MSNALEVIKILQNAGHKAFFVGGCVRDLLLKQEPEDFDIVTSAKPHEVADCFKNVCKVLEVGKNFGITMILLNNEQIEIATFREDHFSQESDGRHPDSVSFTDMEGDSNRRDFTINALFQDPLTKEVFDFHEGQKDLANRVLRFIGDPVKRIEEDKLRMLRAVRFACKGFILHSETLSAIQANAESIKEVSGERIREELFKILSVNPSLGLSLLKETDLLRFILPDVAALDGCKQDCIHHPEGDAFIHTCIVADLLKGEDPLLILAGILHGKLQA